MLSIYKLDSKIGFIIGINTFIIYSCLDLFFCYSDEPENKIYSL